MISHLRKLLRLSIPLLLTCTAGLLAQNTAPVPTTFDIVSPTDGNASSLINSTYSTNHRIFYGGDFFYNGSSNSGGFRGYVPGQDKDVTRIARGNASGSRLTLGGTEWGTDADMGTLNSGASYVANLPGSRWLATSYDPDDAGGATTYPVYTGMNGFIAINEGDTLEIDISGFIDPNNKMVKGDQAADLSYSGRNLKSQSGDGVAGFDGSQNVTYSASNLPAGATFVGNRLYWVPNFIQGDGATDNSVHGGRMFVDANISNGTTTSETAISPGDTSRSASKVGLGVGELRDSLYVIYFKATDDSNQGSDNAMDSLFIMVNDSLPNPPPRFTKRTILRKDSLGVQQTRSFNYLAGKPDTLFSVFEGDSVVVNFYGQDQDSLQGETNDVIAFGLLWNDNLLGVSKGAATTDRLAGFNQFVHRPGSVDTLGLDTVSTVIGSTASGFRFRLQIPYTLATANEKVDSMVVLISDGTSIVADTFALKVRNTNRAPIWDGDKSSLPSDSALTYSQNPAGAFPDSIQTVGPFTINNGETDSTNFSTYVFDPDIQVGDSSGYPLTYTYSGNHQGTLNSSTGLNVYQAAEADTITYTFSIIATDGNSSSKKSTSKSISFRVAPAPSISRVIPAKGAINDAFTIYGTGFGLYDRNSQDTSKVVFYATDANGNRQNIAATITSWAKDKISAVVPWGVPSSKLDASLNFLAPDTIKVISAIYGGYDTYPFIVLDDSTDFSNLEVVNITATSATIRYRTASTGADSVVVASSSDTLDIHSAAFTTSSKFNHYPTFVQYNNGLSEIRSTVLVFKDETPSSDWTHVIQLTDLSPNSLYRFFIGSASGSYAADSTANVNGPYNPKKIDRNTAANNSALTAFRLRTLPVSGATSNIFTVKGKVYYSSGAATNATVALKVVSASSTADTSLALLTTVGSDSSWQLNLANLHSVSGGEFNHAAGDYMLFEFDGSEKGYEEFDTLRAADGVIMTVRSIKLIPRVSYDIELKTGLNLVAVPFRLFKDQPATAHQALSVIPGGTPSISRYITATGVQQTITRAVSGSFVGASDFNLNVEESYFVKVSSGLTVSLEGRVYTDPVPTIQFPGAGIFFVSRPAQDAGQFKSWDAHGIITSVANVSEVLRFNPTLQQYEQYGSSYGGTNFGIDVGQGYMFHITAASSWNPNNTGALLAGAGDKPSTGQGLAMLVQTSGNQSAAVNSPGVMISNLSSAAVVFTWNSGSGAAGRLRLVRVDGAEMVIEPKLLKSGLNYALVTGLKPCMEYKYSVEAQGGLADKAASGTFTSTAIGTGDNPYSLYGRLEDGQGKPVADMLVLAKLTGASDGSQSGYLSALSDENGYWILNLANFKEKNTGTPFVWTEGDKVELTLIGSNYSHSYNSTIQAGSPHDFGLDIQSDGNANTDASGGTGTVALPKAYSLAQNTPNPFNPSTTIRYSLPENSGQVNVRLDVFNLRGQHVKTLVSGIREPGDYQVEWDGTDSAGRTVSSGVYFYRLTSPQFKATRKMIILK